MECKRIKYGKYKCNQWHKLTGLESVSHVIDRIKQELDWTDYELWAVGSILLDVEAEDLDLLIMGPVDAVRVNGLLEGCVRISFEEQVYTDVKFSIDSEMWCGDLTTPMTITYATYTDKKTINGGTVWSSRPVNGFFLRNVTWPMAKALKPGRQYKEPMKLI